MRANQTAPSQTPNFDPLAPLYRWMEWLSFGPYLHRARCAFLGELTTVQNALILGDGDGRFTAALLRASPVVKIDAVDASPAMLRALVRRAGANANRVQTYTADARVFQPQSAKPYDLVVTHFFLDCLTTRDVERLAKTLHRNLAPNAIWLLSDFAMPAEGKWRRLLAGTIIAFLYRAFGRLTGLRIRRLPDHPSAFIANGFTLRARQTLLGGLLIAEKWQKDNVTNVLNSVN
jgi:SAM-dependent methyltransferase